jgi:hypothetical protein
MNERKMNRNVLISCLVLSLVICLVLSVITIAAVIYFIGNADQIPWETGSPTNPAPLPPLVDGEINPQVALQMEQIQMQVIQERGLTPKGDFVRVLFSPEELRQRVLDDFLENYSLEEAREDAIILAAFGLLESDFDLYSFYSELLSEQIAGFYDDETKEMVVVADVGFGAPERLTYAHEYTHALQDQNYDFDKELNYNDEACEDDTERCAAIQALLEGDATLSEIQWFTTYGTIQDREEILKFYDTYESPVYDSAPAFLSQDFVFPYDQGYTFVEYLHDNGDWGTVDRAYRNPPVSTEQILHPERYPDDKPILVELPDFSELLGDGWTEIDRNVMGEWYTYLILGFGLDESTRIDEEEAAQAAAGWGGDAYVVYYNTDQNAIMMVLHTQWDSAQEADEFARAFQEYASGRFGPPESDASGFISWQASDSFHAFYTEDDVTTWILAPDAGLAQGIWQTISGE